MLPILVFQLIGRDQLTNFQCVRTTRLCTFEAACTMSLFLQLKHCMPQVCFQTQFVFPWFSLLVLYRAVDFFQFLLIE
ncbi:hypothetical protein D3C77_282420 [compost metagenome]